MSFARPVAKDRRSRPVATVVDRVTRAPLVWQGAIVLLAISLTVYYTIRTDRDFWYDEAMLVEAIRAEGWLAPWQPMSHFEQSSPWGVYLLQKLTLDVVGFQPHPLRVLGLLAYAVGGICTWLAARIWLGGVAALLAGVWSLASLDVVQTAGDFKHYIFEYCVSGVLLLLAARSSRRDSPRSDLVLLGAAIVAIPFSNTVVFVVPGVVVLLAVLLGRSRRASRVIGGGVLFLLVYGCWYLIAIRPSSVFQIAYPTYRETSTVDLYATIVQTVSQPAATYVVSLTALAAAGLVVALVWRRGLLPFSGPALVAVVGGWVGVRTGLIPFSADRHLLFVVPLVALAAATGLRAVASVLRAAVPPVRRNAALAVAVIGAVVAFGATVTIAPSAGVLRQQAGQALAQYGSTCSSFYVDWWTQPATELYAEADGIADRVHGGVDTKSGVGQQAWAYRVMNDPQPYEERLVAWVRAHPSTCVLTGGRDDENGLVLQPLAAAGLPCVQIGVVPGIQVNRCRKEST